jgi:hypothetical protein
MDLVVQALLLSTLGLAAMLALVYYLGSIRANYKANWTARLQQFKGR